jgi:hypothetical protein
MEYIMSSLSNNALQQMNGVFYAVCAEMRELLVRYSRELLLLEAGS